MNKEIFNNKILSDLIMPYFVIEGIGKENPISGMPGISRLSIDNLLKEVNIAKEIGVKKILLFGVCPPVLKDEDGTYAYSHGNIISSAVKAIKNNIKGITVITDVCLCAYTTHGHCGIVKEQNNVIIDNNKTLEALAKMALVHAEAGADYVAPSAMAKKQVYAIRKVLDKNGYKNTKIMGYSAKFASNFYGPFRDAASSAPLFGDRSGYQLAGSDGKKAIKEIKDDIKEGADIVMIKPALPCLDIIKEASAIFNISLAAFNVSGEYAMIKYGAKIGLWDEKKAVDEIITSIKRAGADIIITYHAKDIAKWVKEK